MDYKRLDILLMEQSGYSRGFAQELIQSSGVEAEGRRRYKPGEKFPADTQIIFEAPRNLYVSRGGYKLEHALDSWSIDLNNAVCLDAGASTGGFTDCMLKRGAAKIFAVDSGTDQLAESLRSDPRVVSMERTNIRGVSLSDFGGPVDFAAGDLSFISLTKVIPAVAGILKPGGLGVLLIKPQFEAGRQFLNKKGVVTDKNARRRAIEDVAACVASSGGKTVGVLESPIKGPEGNVEFLIHFIR